MSMDARAQAKIVSKSFEAPDQISELPNTKAEVVHFGDFTVIRMTFYPGMKYSRDVRPHVPASREKAPSRPVYCESGRIHFIQPDGSTLELKKDGVYLVPPWDNGFIDSWVVGDEPCVLVSFIAARIDISASAAQT